MVKQIIKCGPRSVATLVFPVFKWSRPIPEQEEPVFTVGAQEAEHRAWPIS